MPNRLQDLDVSPFDERAIDHPRRVSISIPELNQRPLRRLQRAFATLESGEIPRRRRAGSVQFVRSPEPGFGKSHLVGRFFATLDRRATKVYVAPFQDPEQAWGSLLATLVREMELPEATNASACMPGEPSQLDAFAQAVLGQAFALDAQSTGGADPDLIKRFRGQPLVDWDLGNAKDPCADWLVGTFRQAVIGSAARLAQLNIKLHDESSPEAWLRVLYAYAKDRNDVDTREAALSWLTARCYEDEADLLGLRRGQALPRDASGTTRNNIARLRVHSFGALGGLFRPFVIAFDQTEVYAQKAELASAFGNLYATLFNETDNVLVVVTANQYRWENGIKPHVDDAHVQRLSTPIELDGIERSLGSELIAKRLRATDLLESDVSWFLDAGWLDEVFALGKMSVRALLQRADARYHDVVDWELPAQSLADLFEEQRGRMASQRRRITQYRPELFQWLCAEVAPRGRADLKVSAFTSYRDFLPLSWDTAPRSLLLGFEERAHHMTWKSIGREVDRRTADGERTCVFIRTEGQHRVPRDSWRVVGQSLEAAIVAGRLRLVELSAKTLAEIHALWELYLHACQGDLQQTSPEQVLDFGGQQLAGVWSAVLGEMTPLPEPEPDVPEDQHGRAENERTPRIAEAITSFIERKLFVKEDVVLEAVRAAVGCTISSEELRQVAQEHAPRVHVIVAKRNAVYQWQS